MRVRNCQGTQTKVVKPSVEGSSPLCFHSLSIRDAEQWRLEELSGRPLGFVLGQVTSVMLNSTISNPEYRVSSRQAVLATSQPGIKPTTHQFQCGFSPTRRLIQEILHLSSWDIQHFAMVERPGQQPNWYFSQVDPFRQDFCDSPQRRVLYVVFKVPEPFSSGVLYTILALIGAQQGDSWKLAISKSKLPVDSRDCCILLFLFIFPFFFFPIVAAQLQSHAAGEASSQETSCCFKPSAIHEPHFWNEPTKPSQQHSVNETPTIDIPPGTRSFCCYCATKQRPQRLERCH